MKETILELINLNSNHPNWTVIKNINLRLVKGEVFALVGESGSGKTTLVNILSGLIEDYTGVIKFWGKPLTENLRQVKFGFLYPESTLIPNLSIAENLSFAVFPKVKMVPFIHWKAVKKRAQELLAQYGINVDIRKVVNMLPREEKRIMEILRILAKKPDIMVLHEPTNGLNVETITKLYRIIAQYRHNGGTVIYVTKQWEEALKVADRITIMSEGVILGDLPVEKARRNPKRLINMFLGISDPENDTVDDDNEDSLIFDAVFKAAELLSSEYELRDILLFFAEHAAKTMNADGCLIDLLDEKTNALIDNVTYNTDKEFKCKLKKEALLKIIKGDSLFYITEMDKNFYNLFSEPVPIRTLICVPVRVKTQIAGIIQIFYKNIYAYSEKEWIYLTMLARQAAIAVENTRLIGRSAFLSESHHRIKNNLQSIISLILLQKSFLDDNIDYKTVEHVFDSIVSRVKSIAVVHDLLSKDEIGRSIINLKEIVEMVLQFAIYPASEKEIKIHLDLEDIFISYNKATTVSLIINELVENCFEHAFLDLEEGAIWINCRKQEERLLLSIKDNGRGFPQDFEVKNSKSLGMTIIYALVTNDLKGEIQFTTKAGEGTEFKLDLPVSNFSLLDTGSA